MNMLAKRREELSKEVFERAKGVRKYFIENAPPRYINLGHLDEEYPDVEFLIKKNGEDIEYWLQGNNGKMEDVFSSILLVKYEDKIRKSIDEANNEMIKELRGVLDGN